MTGGLGERVVRALGGIGAQGGDASDGPSDVAAYDRFGVGSESDDEGWASGCGIAGVSEHDGGVSRDPTSLRS